MLYIRHSAAWMSKKEVGLHYTRDQGIASIETQQL